MLFKALCRIKSELVVPILIVGYSTFYYLEVHALPSRQTNLLLIGPVYFLILLSAVMYVFFQLRAAIRELRDPKRTLKAETPPAVQKMPDPFGGDDAESANLLNGKFLIFSVSTVVYVLLFSILGFATSSFLYLAVLMYLLGMRSLKVVFWVPFAVVATLYVSMVVLMRFPLPAGWLI